MALADDFEQEMKGIQSVPPGMRVRYALLPAATDPESRLQIMEVSIAVIARHLTEALRKLDDLTAERG